MEGVRTVQHERLTIQEAAHRLGVRESAIRKRIKRGTLQREKTEDGRVLVYMEPSVPGAEEVRTPERDALISEMQQRLALLERELDVRTEEIRRRDTIIMNMTEAMKALNPPPLLNTPQMRESPLRAPALPASWESSAKSSTPNVPAAKWRSPRCARGWLKSSVAAKRPNGSATICVENCSLPERRGNRLRRSRSSSSRVGASPTPMPQALRRAHGGPGGVGC